MALSEVEVETRSRCHDLASTASTSTLYYLSSSATGLSGGASNDHPNDNSNGLAYPVILPTSEQFVSANYLSFGFCANENYRYRSAHKPGAQIKEHVQDPPYYILLTTYLSYFFLFYLGNIRDFLRKRLYPTSYRHLLPSNVSYPPLGRCSAAGCFLLLSPPNSYAYVRPLNRVMPLFIRISTPSTPDGFSHVYMTVFSRQLLVSLDERSRSSIALKITATLP